MIWFLNGRYLPQQKAKIPVNDLAILRGYGIFDFLVTYDNKPFLLDDHIDRLFNSARQINLQIPYSKKQLRSFVLKTIKKNRSSSLTVRIIVTGGVSSSNIFPEGKSSVAILIEKRTPYPKSCYQKGIKLKTYQYLRFAPQAKHINYLPAVVVKNKANQKSFLEVLYVYQKQILECTTSNFYIVKKETLITPKENILHGITKKIVLQLAKKILKVAEKPIYVNDLKNADEALISASDKEIMPVVQIDNSKINQGKPGKYTKKLIKVFHNYTENYAKNFKY